MKVIQLITSPCCQPCAWMKRVIVPQLLRERSDVRVDVLSTEGTVGEAAQAENILEEEGVSSVPFIRIFGEDGSIIFRGAGVKSKAELHQILGGNP